MLPPIRIRDGLDPRPFAQAYAEDGYVQTADFLAPESADGIVEMLAALPYALVAPDPRGDTLVITDEAVKKFGEAEVRKFLNDTLRRASGGFAFIHQSYGLQDEYKRDPGDRAAPITEFLQSRAFLDFGASVIGQEVTGVRVQASKYRRGDFLTLHDDSHSKNRRLAAFTLGFTRGWRPDWGGQLLFHDARGDVTRGFIPRFNMLTLFTVPRAHSVAPVAAYAGVPRYSLTGWLIADPT